MSLRKQIALLLSNLILCVAIILLTVFLMNGWGVLISVAFYVVAGAGIAVSSVTFFLKKVPLLKTAFVIEIIAAVVLATLIILNEVGHLNDYPTDEAKIQGLIKLIEGTGAWGMLVFFVIQILQVVILPLPAIVCYVPGTVIWGAPMATLIASLGVITGSVICYFIGKMWGKKAVVWIAGEAMTEKYSAYFGKRGKGIFVLMQILPFFPDDILCLIAGLTSMNFPFFLTIMCTVRPAIIAIYCFFGSGEIIPFSGWGIYVWIAIIAVCVVLAVLSFKYQDRFESFLVNLFTRKKHSINLPREKTLEMPDGVIIELENELDLTEGRESADGDRKDKNFEGDDNKAPPSDNSPTDGENIALTDGGKITEK